MVEVEGWSEECRSLRKEAFLQSGGTEMDTSA